MDVMDIPTNDLQTDDLHTNNLHTKKGFPPIVADHSQILILGSMPSVASLKQQQYYGNPRNHFWLIMSQLFGFDISLPYADKVATVLDQGIAIWDVIHCCYRPGSADSAIDPDSITPQNFHEFFLQYPNIEYVFFNGRKAEQVYRGQVLPELGSDFDYIQYQLLPSTSPAHASLSKDNKTLAWLVIKEKLAH